MHLRPLMILRRDKNPACTQMMLLQNVQSWQLICPQTVRKKARSLKVNDIQTQSLTSNPILSATLIAQLGMPDGMRTRSVSR